MHIFRLIVCVFIKRIVISKISIRWETLFAVHLAP